MLIYNGQIIAGGGTIVLPMTRAEYEANKAILDSADVWVDLTDEPDQVATAEQIAYSVDGVQKSMGYIGDIATKAVAKVEPSDTALYLHEVGEYFINKDGDACKVDLQIPVNGTITLGTNCHVLTKGVANDINSNLSANKHDGFVDISSYTSTNPFTTPCDGYLQVAAGGASGYAKAVITDPNDVQITIISTNVVYNNPNVWNSNTVFVKKGMKVFKNTDSTAPNQIYTYIKLTD